jgi:thiopeptide-type bacteriocin biosynthesis protein
VEAQLKEAASEFFKLWPSTTSLADDLIRRNNITILRDAPLENDDAVYPDNSLHPFEFRPESERYGGDLFLDSSLGYFALSSALALQFIGTHGDLPWGRQLPMISGILARQAWGFAANKEELLDLVDYSRTFWGDAPTHIAAKGDRAFARQAETFLGMFRHQFQESDGLAQGAHCLSKDVSSANPVVRRRILHSHMHLMANRLGLQNLEEIYLCRILRRSLERLIQSDAGFDAALALRHRSD